ncbi:MAG TPA: N,N-dimethylformamidase beta subunit family domain-containing protein, partial [Vicinamibacterales bacterium]
MAALILAERGSGRIAVLAQGGCTPPYANAVVAENCLTGDADWDLTGGTDSTIQGFADNISVDVGQTVNFKINTDATTYRIDIYRLGYYSSAGARKITSSTITLAQAQVQPACASDTLTGLVDCGTWATSASWSTAGQTSGIFLAKLTRIDAGVPATAANHIVFVVRDDSRHSDVLFQTSDTTWQAYNRYGGNSLYFGGPGVNPPPYSNPGRAYKVSYNRPFDTRSHDPQSFLFNAEYPMVRWLEANGYDVSYFTGVDSDRSGALIKDHKAFLSVGHDEYWSGAQRANVEAARDAGVHLAFFSGNEVFWKTRWEASLVAPNVSHRTLVSYKETLENAKIDPDPAVWTGTWRDARFSPPADGGRPENGLTGTMYSADCCTHSIMVPSELGAHRFWRNTGIGALPPATSATLTQGSLGYEWDEDLDNGFRPAGLTRLSSTTVDVPAKFGAPYSTAPGTATHSLTLYRKDTLDQQGNTKKALVFGAGTVQWSWGLDTVHDREASTIDSRMQQATINLFADMGVQPGSIQTGMIAGSASTDTVAPTSVITAPTGGNADSGSRLTISGTASDTGGVVAG